MSIETTPQVFPLPAVEITVPCTRLDTAGRECGAPASWTASVHSHAIVGGVAFGATAGGPLCDRCKDELLATTDRRYPVTCSVCRTYLAGPDDIMRNLERL